MKCPYCQEEIRDGALKCRHCSEILRPEEYRQFRRPVSQEFRAVYDLPPYYQNEFKKIDANQGKFTPRWNWASFLFGVFWYFYRGMWAKGIIMIGACFLLVGLPAPFFWVYCGVGGNYDYYLLKVRDKQLW